MNQRRSIWRSQTGNAGWTGSAIQKLA